MLNPYDLGNEIILESCYKVNIDDFVSKARKSIKLRIIEAQIEILGISVKLTTSKTRFDGERFWFSCPICQKRVGTIFKHPYKDLIGCRLCLNLKYKKQRYKGMVELYF